MLQESSGSNEEHELLLVSEFCRHRASLDRERPIDSSESFDIPNSQVHVSIQVLDILPPLSSNDLLAHDIYSTIYTHDSNLLKNLRVFDGQLCLLKSSDKKTSDRREHPVRLTLLSPNSSSSHSTETSPESHVIYVPPCIVAAVGFHSCTRLSRVYYISPLQFTDGSRINSLTHLKRIKTAALREIYVPPCDILPDIHSLVKTDYGNSVCQWNQEKRRQKTLQSIQRHFSSSIAPRLMNQFSIISIYDNDLCVMRFYQLGSVEFNEEKSSTRTLDSESTCFVLSSASQMILLPQEDTVSKDRSPLQRIHIDAAERFNKSIILRLDNKVDEHVISHIHPSVPCTVDALIRLQLLSNISLNHGRTLTVVGHEDNHLQQCLDVAAASVGMRIIHVRGLAAFAYRVQSMNLSDKTGIQNMSGTIRDKLIGLVAAFDCARRSAPCILHVSLEGEIHCDETVEDEYDNQRRLLSCVQDELREINCYGDMKRGLDSIPHVQLIFSLTTIVGEGPLVERLTQDVVHLTDLDENYSRMLWSDGNSFDALYTERLRGRSANEILFANQMLYRDIAESKSIDALNQKLLSLFTETEKKIGFFHGQVTCLCKVPNVRWDDIGGLQDVREEIFDAIELPLLYSDLFLGMKRRGILLYGPPGSGKTLVAKAIATEYGLPFISVKGPELLGSYVGESESNIRNVFALARDASSSSKSRKGAILFFDEIDSLAPHRGNKHDGGGVMDRITVSFLGELDMVRGKDQENIFVICATNRPDLLDPALLRPGRLDRVLYLGLPDQREERIKILAAQCRKFKFDFYLDSFEMAREVIDHLPPNLSGADFASISSTAVMKSIERLCHKAEMELIEKKRVSNDSTFVIEDILSEWNEEDFVPIVTRQDFISASENIIPSVNEHDLEIYEKLKTSFS